MKCPHCGEEIKRFRKECPVCCEEISWFYSIKNVFGDYKKTAVKTVATLVLGILCVWGGISIYNNSLAYIENPTYESIVEHEVDDFYENSKSAIEVANIIIKQDEDISKLLKSITFGKKKDNVFSTYLKNMEYYAAVLSAKIMNEETDKIKFDKNRKIVSPVIPVISTYIDDIHDITVVDLNIEYINDSYSKYLCKGWKEYLSQRKKEYLKIHNNPGWYGNLEYSTLFSWIMARDKFSKDYPKFYTEDSSFYPFEGCYLPVKYYVDNVFRNTYGDYGHPLSKETLREYEKYLEKADKNTQSYKYIKQAYDILKKNDWIKFDEFLGENEFGGWGD